MPKVVYHKVSHIDGYVTECGMECSKVEKLTSFLALTSCTECKAKVFARIPDDCRPVDVKTGQRKRQGVVGS